VSEHEQPEATAPHPESQPDPQAVQTNEVVVDDSEAQPTYANFCRVMATPEEVILDFGLNLQPFATGHQHVKANHRIVMNQFTTKRLLSAIAMTIQRHEQTFGAIELDVQRRASQTQAQPGPSGTHGPPDPPQIIRL
jgi:hypothetical protein